MKSYILSYEGRPIDTNAIFDTINSNINRFYRAIDLISVSVGCIIKRGNYERCSILGNQ